MADRDWSDDATVWRPTGLTQQQDRVAAAGPDWSDFAQRSSPEWSTGGQTGSAQNALSSDSFLSAMYKQQDEARETGENPYGRDDFTGVALYTGRVGARDFQFGDTWVDGQKTGNILTDYNQEDANKILSQLMLSPDEQKRIYTNAAGDQDSLSTTLADKAAEYAEQAGKYETARAFEAQVDANLDEWTAAQDAAAISGGVLGGAATGATIGGALGSVVPLFGNAAGAIGGAIIGGIAGLGGSLLNLDQIRDNYARAEARLEASDNEGVPLWLRTAGEYGSAVASNAAVGANVIPGFTGLVQGNNPFDNETAFERAVAAEDEAAQNWLMAANVAGSVVDLATLFGGNFVGAARAPGALALLGRAGGAATEAARLPVALNVARYASSSTTYQLGIAGQVVGDAVDLFEGRTFDPSSGTYREMDMGQRLATLGVMGLNMVQMRMPTGLGTSLLSGARQSNVVTGMGRMVDNVLSKSLSKNPQSKLAQSLQARRSATSKVSDGGLTYYLDDAGQAVAMRLNAGVFAPSELLKGAAAGVLALRNRTVRSGLAVGMDDVYKASQKIANLPPVAGILVNATVESAEEAYESILRGYTIDNIEWSEVAWSALGGALGGAAMSLPFTLLARRQSDNQWDQLQAFVQETGADFSLSKDDWNALTDAQRLARIQEVHKLSGTLGEGATQIVLDTLATAQAQQGSSRLVQALRTRTALIEEKIRETKGIPAVSMSSKASLNPDPNSEGYHIVTGVRHLLDLYSRWLGVVQQTEGVDGPMGVALSALIQRISQEYRAFMAQASQLQGNSEDVRSIREKLVGQFVNTVNGLLESAWSGEGGEDLARAVGVLIRRYPQDNPNSLFLGLLQISEETVMEELSGRPVEILLHPSEGLKGLTMDFDGDYTVMVEFMQDPEAWRDRRSGMTYNAGPGGGGVFIGQHIQQTQALKAIHYANVEGNSEERASIAAAVDVLGQQLVTLLTDAQGSLLVPLDFLQDTLLTPLASGHPSDSLFEDFFTALGSHPAGQRMTDYGRITLTNYYFKISRLLIKFTNDIMAVDRVATTRIYPVQALDEGIVTPSMSRLPKVASPQPGAAPATDETIQSRQADSFRGAGYFHYSPLTTSTLQSLFVNSGAEDLYYADLYVNTGEIRGDAEKAFEGDAIVQDTLRTLNRVRFQLNEQQKADPTAAPWTLADLAYYKAPGSNETFLQIALKSVVRQEMSRYPNAESPTVQEKFAQYRNKDRIDAATLVLGGQSLDDLLGTSASEISLSGTLKTASELYAFGGEALRAQMRQAMEDHPLWDGRYRDAGEDAGLRGAHPTSINIIGRIILAEARTVSMDPKTGIVHSKFGLGKEDHQVSETRRETQKELYSYLTQAAKTLKDALKLRGLTYRGELTPEIVYTLLDTDDQLALRLVETLSENVTQQLYDPISGLVSKGLMNYLTNPDTDAAVKSLWLEDVLAGIVAVDNGDEKPKDRIVQLLVSLRALGENNAHYENALRIIMDSKTPEIAVAALNRLYPDAAPQLTWLRDEGFLAPGGATGGWSLSVTGKPLRDSLKALRDTLRSLDRSLVERKTVDKDSRAVEMLLRAEQKQGGGPTIDAFNRRLTWLKTLPPIQGGRLRTQALVASALVRGNTANKGATDTGFEARGAFTASGEPLVFGPGTLQVVGDQASYSEYDLAMHPEVLLQPATIMTADGDQINWPGLNVDNFLKMYGKPLYRPLLDSLLDPALYDTDAVQGTGLSRSVFSLSPNGVPRGLGGLIRRDGHGGATPHAPHLGSSLQSRVLATALADARTQSGEWQRWTTLYYHARISQTDETLTESQLEDLAVESMNVAGELVQILASLPSEQLRIFEQTLEESLGGDISPETLASDPAAILRQQDITEARLVLQKNQAELKLKFPSLAQSTIDALSRELTASVEGISLGRAIYNTYAPTATNEKGEPVFSAGQKLILQEKFLKYGNILSTIVDKNTQDLRDFSRVIKSGKVLAELPSEKSWTILANSLFNTEIADLLNMGSAITSMGLVASKKKIQGDYGDLADENYSYLLRRILENVGGLKESARSLGEVGSLDGDGRTAARRVLSLIYGQDGTALSHYSGATLARTIAALDADTTSAATPGISSGGILPELFAKPSQATEYDWTFQPTSPARVVTLSLNELRGLVPDPDGTLVYNRDSLFTPRTDSSGLPYLIADLDGRVFTDILVSYTDADGNRVQDVPLQSLTSAATFNLANRFPRTEENAGWFATDIERIGTSLAEATSKSGAIPFATDISITASYFHPADAPIEGANAYVYSGAYNIAAPTKITSPLAGILEVNGEVQLISRTSLDALKTHTTAMYNARIMEGASASIRQFTQGDGRHDYRGLFTQLVSNHLRSTALAGSEFPTAYVHVAEAYYRLVTAVKVRWTDPDETPRTHVFSLQEMIAANGAWPAVPGTEGLAQATDFVEDIIFLPIDHVNYYLDHAGTEWNGTWDNSVLERLFPGMFDVTRANQSVVQRLGRTSFVGRQAARTSVPSSVRSDRDRRQYSQVLEAQRVRQLQAQQVRLNHPDVFSRMQKEAQELRERMANSLYTPESVYSSIFDSFRSSLQKDVVTPDRRTAARMTALQRAEFIESKLPPVTATWMVSFEASTTGSSVVQRLAQMTSEETSETQILPAPGDHVLLDVSEVLPNGEPEAQANEAYRAVTQLLDAGFEVHLFASVPSDVAGTVRQRLAVTGKYSMGASIVRHGQGQYQTADELAENSLVGQVQVLDRQNRVAIFGTTQVPTFEGATLVQRSESASSLGTFEGLQRIALGKFPGFHLADPQSGSISGRAAVEVWEQLQSELTAYDKKQPTPLIDHLFAMAKTVGNRKSTKADEKAFIKSLRKTRLYDPTTLLPAPESQSGTEYVLEAGDIFFLTNSQGDIILARFGHEQPEASGVDSTALGIQLRTPLTGGNYRRGIATFGHGSQQGISIRSAALAQPLEVVDRTTLNAMISMDLDLAYTKILNNLFKTTAVLAPKSLPFDLPDNSQSLFHSFWSDPESVEGKQYSDLRLGSLDGSSAILGHSFVESVVRTFGLYSDAEWANIQQAILSNDPAARALYENAIATAKSAIQSRVTAFRETSPYASTPQSARADLAELAALSGDMTDLLSTVAGVPAATSEADLAHQQITSAIIIAAAVPGTDIYHLLHSNGLINDPLTGQGLHVLGAFFDGRKPSDPIKRILWTQQNARVRKEWPWATLSEDGQNLVATVTDKATGESRRFPITLNLAEAHISTDDAPALQLQSFQRKTSQGLSRSQEASAYLLGAGAQSPWPVDLSKLQVQANTRTQLPETARDLFKALTKAQVRPRPEPLSRAQQVLLDREQAIREESNVALTFEEWAAEDKAQYEKDRSEFATKYLQGREEYVDYMVRLLKWRRHSKDTKYGDVKYGWVSASEAFESLAYFSSQLAAGRFPMFNAPTGAMDGRIVFLMAEQAWKNRESGAEYFMPSNNLKVKVREGNGSKTVKLDLPPVPTADANWSTFLEYYMNVAIAELYATPRESYDEITASAYLQTYEQYFADDLNGARLDPTFVTSLNLFDPDQERLLLSIDLNRLEELAADPLISQEFKESFLQNLALDYTISPDYTQSIPETVLRNLKTRRRLWDQNIRVLARDVSGEQFTTGAVVHRARTKLHAATITNTIVQGSILLRVANPVLLVAAVPEMGIRIATERLAGLATGPTANKFTEQGITLNRTIDSFRDNGVSQLMQDMFDDSPYVRPGGSRRINTAIRKVLRWQSWTRTPRSTAKSFVEAVGRSVLAAPGAFGGLTFDTAMAALRNNPNEFKKNYPDLWDMGLNAASSAFGMRMTGASYLLNRGLSALSEKHPTGSAFLDLAVRGPLAFQGYFTNVLTNMLGLQGLENLLSAGTALFLDRFDSTRGLSRDLIQKTQNEVSFANLVIQGGVTQAGLFILAMLAQSFLGNDDEWEEKKRLEEQGIITAWDIRKFENDWRNAEALYLEGTFLEGLSGMYQVGEDEDGNMIAPVVPAWYLKQFTSPFIGMARFMRSGNFLDIVDGYADALGAMPLANDLISAFTGMTQTNALLYQRSIEAVSGETVTDQELASSYNWMVRAIMNYERIYAEWGFLNTLYSALDDFQRDPFARADLDADGNIQVDKLGNPLESSLQAERFSADGTLYEGSQGYSGLQGTLRSYATQRAGTAAFLTLISGFQQSAMRWDMPIRDMKVQKQEITSTEDAAMVILSVWDEKAGQEKLNEPGAAALIRSIHAGLLKDGDPALNNIYLTAEQRYAASEILMEELLSQGIESGLTIEEAEQNAYDLFYGDPDRPYIQPLYDAIWSRGDYTDVIPYGPVQTYQFLNTTFAMGPDGRYWATGVERAVLSSNAAGLNPIQGYAGSGAGTVLNSTLSIDERLNAADLAGNVNLGLRSMTKVNDSLFTVRDEDIINEIQKGTDRMLDALRKSGNTGGTPWTRYGSGGGGGGGGGYSKNPFMPYLNSMRAPYWDNIPSIYADNPIVRRVSIRRERFSSDRGRLLSWQ